MDPSGISKPSLSLAIHFLVLLNSFVGFGGQCSYSSGPGAEFILNFFWGRQPAGMLLLNLLFRGDILQDRNFAFSRLQLTLHCLE